MRKNLLSLQRLALVALFAVIGLAQSWAADYTCWTQAIYKMVIKDQAASTADSYVAGKIFVSTTLLTDESQIEAVAEEITTAPLYHFGAAAACKQEYYFYVKANPGYVFLGWASSWSSAKPTFAPSSGYDPKEANKVGDYYWYKGTTSSPYANNTEEKPTKLTRYAVFEQQASDAEPTGDGADFVSAVVKGTDGLTFSEGSMSSKPTVSVTFTEPVNFVKVPDYGQLVSCVNPEAIKYVSVTNNETKKALASSDYAISATGTYVEGTGDMGEEDWVPGHYEKGVGTIQLPINIAKGTYTIHLPYGLYYTVGTKGVSQACDIVVTVTEAQKLPMVVKETSPAEGYEWDAFEGSGSTANNDYDGIPGMVTVIFDQPIGEVVAGKTPTLIKKDNNHSFKCLNYSKAILQTAQAKATLNVSFQQIPSGEYVCTIPAGIVKSQTGVENDEIVINFSVKANNYKFDEWALSEYTTKSATPSDGSSVDVLDKIVVSFSRDGFAAPVAIKGNPVVTFQDYVEDWSKVDPNSAEGKPVVKTTDLNLASTLSVEDGKVVITLDKAYKSADNQVVMVTIPADIVYNVVGGENMTAQELCEANAAKSPAYTFKINLNGYAKALPLHDLSVNDWSVYGGPVTVGGKDAEGNYVTLNFYDGVLSATEAEIAAPDWSSSMRGVEGTGSYTDTETETTVDAVVTFPNDITYHITGTYVKPVWSLADPTITLTDEALTVEFDVTPIATADGYISMQPSISLTLGDDVFTGGCGEIEAVDGKVTFTLPLENFTLGWTMTTPEFKAGDVVTVAFTKMSVYNNLTIGGWEKIWDDGIAKTYDVTVTAATAIKNINAAANNNVMFNLAGQRVNNAKGIVIMNGKKVVK